MILNFCLIAYETNPYALWLIAYHDTFSNVLELIEQIDSLATQPGSLEDAIHFFSGNLY